MQSGPIWVVKIAIIFISLSMTRICSLQTLLADLHVNVISVTTPAKHYSYDSIILILTVLKLELEILQGGAKSLKGRANAPPLAPPLKETLNCVTS